MSEIPVCPTCGQPKPYGPQTLAEVMAEYEAEMERYYVDPKPLPVAPPPGWDWDLWSEFRLGVTLTEINARKAAA